MPVSSADDIKCSRLLSCDLASFISRLMLGGASLTGSLQESSVVGPARPGQNPRRR